jgi:hypothetical protein
MNPTFEDACLEFGRQCLEAAKTGASRHRMKRSFMRHGSEIVGLHMVYAIGESVFLHGGIPARLGLLADDSGTPIEITFNTKSETRRLKPGDMTILNGETAIVGIFRDNEECGIMAFYPDETE